MARTKTSEKVVAHVKEEIKKYPLIERLEKEFDKHPQLRLSKFLKKKIKGFTLKEFIDSFINEYNLEYETRVISSNTDEETSGSMRSIQDIYSICKYYYPEAKLKDVFQGIFELASENKIFGKWYCHTINKFVFSEKHTAYDKFTIRKDTFISRVNITTYDVFRELGFKQSNFINNGYNNTKKTESYNQVEEN
jgi:hypothetical protein